MKKIYLSLALAFLSFAGFAQLEMIDVTTGLTAMPSYTFTIEQGSNTFPYEFDIHNNASNAVTVRSKRYLIQNASGQEAYYCFGAMCYSFNSNPFYSPAATTSISAGGTIPSGAGTYGLTTDFDNYTVLGNTKVLYVIYNTANPNDSVAVEMNYIVSPVGLAKIDAKNFTMSNPMPNPAVNNTAVKYSFASQPKSSSIKVYNMVGMMVKEIRVEGTEGKAQLDVSGLTEGVYFYSLIVNDKVVSTKRLIVSK
jgi:hypothetical protein